MNNIFRVYTLMYHRVSENEIDSITLQAKEFEQHLQFLKDNYLCPEPAQLIENFKKKQHDNVSKNVCLITFDDGYEDNFRLARPLLKKYGLKALVFLVSDYIGKDNNWNHKYGKQIRHMNLDEIKEAMDVFHYGCHTANHYNLTKLNDTDLQFEVVESKKKLQKLFGYSVNTFGYPFGFYDKRIVEFVNNHFVVSFSTYNKGKNFSWGINPHTVRRINPLDYEAHDFPEHMFKFRNTHLYK